MTNADAASLPPRLRRRSWPRRAAAGRVGSTETVDLAYLHSPSRSTPSAELAASPASSSTARRCTICPARASGTSTRGCRHAQTGPAVYVATTSIAATSCGAGIPAGGRWRSRGATEATFVYTNAAPQAAGFNQSKELWLGLEDHVLAYAEANDQRISVFTAPVLDEDDPPYRGIRVPLRFWKIAAWATARTLAAAGFVLDQTELVDTTSGLTVTPLGAFRTFQVPIADIGRTRGPRLRSARRRRHLRADSVIAGQRLTTGWLN